MTSPAERSAPHVGDVAVRRRGALESEERITRVHGGTSVSGIWMVETSSGRCVVNPLPDGRWIVDDR